MDSERASEALQKAANALWGATPIMLGAILLISLADAFVPDETFASLFSGNPLSDALVGSVLGSIFAGNPVTSYVIGGELRAEGVSLLAVTAFLVSWVTVGLVQFPAESILLGKRFAISRNAVAFASSILAAFLAAFLVGVI